ncbi:glycosyltransferase family 4 protein [Tolypothrix sp. PCC 7910]|nr:glycosyltransferase family 4 protein [Tolypothrix sp. PCC 7910]
MARILFISAHAPTDYYPQAGQKIALRHLEDYIHAGATVDVVVVANQAEITAATDLVSLVGNNLYTYPLKKWDKFISCLTHLHIPFKFASRWLNPVGLQLKQFLQNHSYDVVHFEYPHAAVYLEDLQPLINLQSAKTIISVHDLIFQSFLRKAEKNHILGIEVAKLFQYEKKLYSAAQEIWVLSKKDRDILTSLFAIPDKKVFVKPPNINKFFSNIKRHPSKIEPKSLLFWAAMNRPENEQAILIFVNKCFRLLLEKDPKFKLYIVGANPSGKVLALASKQIIITGFVEDPTSYFEQAKMGIVPLLEGAGIKLKTLEMLAAGLPVIATTVGAEGVDDTNKNLIINDNFDDWVKLINQFCDVKML